MCSDQGAPIETKAVKVSLLPDAGPGEALAQASRFREDLFDWLPRKSAVAAAMTAMLMVAPVIAATDAQVLGNNREVSRSCGTNHVSSGFTTEGVYSWAQTAYAPAD